MPSQIVFSQYTNVISLLKNAFSIVGGPNGEYDPVEGSKLQLLTVSLGDDFPNLKAKLTDISSSYAAQSSSREQIIREKIQDIINELENDIVDLILSFRTQAAANNINFTPEQLNFLFRDQ